jgi:uncharacterized membrane protein YbhN (UPF0104 family)
VLGWVVGVGKYLVGFGILAAVMYRYWEPDLERGMPGVRDLLRGPIEWQWLLACWLLIVVGFSLQILRWYLLVRTLNIPLKLSRAYQLGLLGLVGNTFLPGAVGGDFFRAYFLAKDSPGRRTAAVLAVLMDRGFGLFGLMFFAATVGLAAWMSGDARMLANADLQWLVIVTAAIAGGSILGFLALGLLPGRGAERLAGHLRALPAVGVVFANLWYAVWEFRQHLRVMGYGVVLTAVSQLAMVLAFYLAARVFPPSNPDAELATLPEVMVIAPIGFLVQALPLAPGGVGVSEAAFAGLYRLADRPETQGVVARLAMRIAELALALLAWIAYFRMRKELRKAKADAAGDSSPPPVPQPD